MPRIVALAPLVAACAVALSGCGRDHAGPGQQGATAGADLATVEVGAVTAPAELLVDGVVEAVHCWFHPFLHWLSSNTAPADR